MRILFVILLLFFSLNAAHAYDLKKVTDDTRIVAALKILDMETLEQIFKDKRTQIIFYDFGLISYKYKNHFALTSQNSEIVINAKYRNAPKEVLAALIAHECVHLAAKGDLEEEVSATIAEITQWGVNVYHDDMNPLVQRLNNLSQIYAEGGRTAIKRRIMENEFYHGLF